jgi:mannose-6-phosphate isomerase-like protein (cupin superfamily)
MSGIVSLREKLTRIEQLWHPYIVAQVDGYHVKLAKVQGEFVWHAHEEQDEMFLLLDGELTIRMHGGDVTLVEGDLFVVPRGVEHCPQSAGGASILLLERADTAHTGDVESELTVAEQEWI